MDSEFRKLIENAKGTTQHVIAIILDIRGFTPFCKEIGESLDIANFLKRVYIRIIDDYFPKASFYKPTGDGLLIIIPYSEESPEGTVTDTIKKCLSLVQDFGKLCEGDNMIYFAPITPKEVGIGISRGTSCCISSDETIIDYSGKVINLASRLNDLARPSGIVFDPSLGFSLLPKEMQKLFLCENVSIRGIAEDKLMPVYFTKQYTIIPPSRKVPLREPKWLVATFRDSFKALKESHDSGTTDYNMQIDKPFDEKQITVELTYETASKVTKVFFLGMTSKGVRYRNIGRKHFVSISYPVMIEELSRRKLEDDMIVNFEISYPSAKENV